MSELIGLQCDQFQVPGLSLDRGFARTGIAVRSASKKHNKSVRPSTSWCSAVSSPKPMNKAFWSASPRRVLAAIKRGKQTLDPIFYSSRASTWHKLLILFGVG